MTTLRRHVRREVVLFIAIVISASVRAQPSEDSVRPLECVESIQIPQYPPLARGARLAGNVHAHTTIVGRSATDVKVDGAHPILQEAVVKSLKGARFSASCDHVGIELIFIFKIEGEQTGMYDMGVVTFRWPNEFAITVRPPTPQP
jgi:hypothetical protein